jgi:hypothetical protein
MPRGPQPERLEDVCTGLVRCAPAHPSVHRVRTARDKRVASETSYSFKFDMEPYTWYRAEARAHNFHGWGPWSGRLSFRTPATEPRKMEAPWSVATTPTTIKLRWGTPRDNGSKIEAYTLQWQQEKEKRGKVVKGEWTPWRRLMVVLDHAYLIQFLKPGKGYRFRVQARNRVGYGPFSTSSPEIFTYKSLIVSDLTATSVTLSWAATAFNDIKRYEIQQLDYDRDEWLRVSDRLKQNFIKVRNLLPDSEYCFRVRALSASQGWAPWEDCVAAEPFRTLKSQPMKMSAPKLKHKCYDRVTIEWREPRNNGHLVDRYQIQMRRQGSRLWTKAAEVDEHVLELEIPNLARVCAYAFRVLARNKLGWSPAGKQTGAILTCATSPPRRPFCRERRTDSCFVLEWKKPEHTFRVRISHYEVEIREKLTGQWEVLESQVEGRSMLVDDLFPVTPYYFRVRCFTKFGWSAFSEPSDAIKTKRRL